MRDGVAETRELQPVEPGARRGSRRRRCSWGGGRRLKGGSGMDLGFKGCKFLFLYEANMFRAIHLAMDGPKSMGQFRPKWSCYIPPLFNFFFFIFHHCKVTHAINNLIYIIIIYRYYILHLSCYFDVSTIY
jgi:hypothetical protein